jgi:hypothetical protein
MFKRIFLPIAMVLCLAITQVGCGGPLSRLDDVLPYVPAVIDFAVRSGRISDSLGVKLKDDVSSGNQAVATVKQCLSADVKADVTCYIEFGNEWRAIIGRNHVQEANDPKISLIFGLATQIVDLVVRKNTQPAGARGGSQDLDKQIKAKIDQLEREVKN